MAVLRATDKTDFTFSAGSLDADVLRVHSFRGTEGISRLFRYDIDLTSLDAAVDFDAVVGQKGSLVLKTTDGERWINGIVSRFEQTGQGRKLAYYSACLVPRVWTLTRRRQSRIFQDLATPDILKKVLKDAGIPSDEVKTSLQRSYKPRKYCVQYRESDFDFLSRIMEEEGIFYLFDDTEDGHVFVMGDSPSAHAPVEGDATIPYHDGESEMPGEEHITSFRFVRSVRTGAVHLREFDFKKPTLNLKVEKKASTESSLEHYEYPGDYPDAGLGDEYAKIRLEEHRARREMGAGDSTCRRLAAGYRFTLDKYFRDDFNQEYLLVDVDHYAQQPQAAEEDLVEPASPTTYESRFECIPSGVPFRPPRETPQPIVEGPQTAIVTGPAGEEIHTDEHGRVKVFFHWDREGSKNDKSSCWVRVSQGWGGPGWGSMFLPRIGQEVIVEFLEGDPDRPLITGRVYNADNPPPYSLPGDKTKSVIKTSSSPGGGGANELRFEDAAGGEEVFFHAQKDHNIIVENDKTQKVGHDEKREVANDETVTIGSNETWHVVSNRTKTVDGNQSETIKGDKTIAVNGKHAEKINGDKSLTVGGGHTEKVSGDMKIDIHRNLTETVLVNYSEKVGVAMELKVGGAYSQTVGAKKSVEVKGDATCTVKGNDSESVDGTKGVKVKGALSIGTEAGASMSARQDMSLTSDANVGVKGKKIGVNGTDEIALVCGSASITLKKNGDIVIKGKNIDIKGSGNIVMKGQKIQQN